MSAQFRGRLDDWDDVPGPDNVEETIRAQGEGAMRLSQAAQEFEPPSKAQQQSQEQQPKEQAQAQQQRERLQQQRREAFERRHRDWEHQGEWVPDGDRVTCNTCQANLSFKSIVKHNNKKHDLYGKGREMSTRVMRFLPRYLEPHRLSVMFQLA